VPKDFPNAKELVMEDCIAPKAKPGKGRSAKGMPEGWEIAERLFPRIGK